MTRYNIDHQYQAYLKRMELDEESLTPEMKRQLRAAFYGAWGQLLDYLKNDLPGLKPMQRAGVLTSMETQLDYFFELEMGFDLTADEPQSGPPVSGQIQAPFTPEQVDRLNAYQQSGKGHPFTGDPTVDGRPTRSTCPDGQCILIATTEGWICPCKKYTQNWAHAFMAL